MYSVVYVDGSGVVAGAYSNLFLDIPPIMWYNPIEVTGLYFWQERVYAQH